MSSVPDDLRRFVSERLTAAAEEIFGVFHKTIVRYEEEIERQRKLLDIVWKPDIKLRRIELPQQHICKEEEVLTEQQQLWKQEGNSNLDREEPEGPQIKEEQEELYGGQLGLKQESDDFLLTSTSEQNGQSDNWTLHWNPGVYPEESQVKMPVIVSVVSEVNSELQQLSDNSHAADSQDWNTGKHLNSKRPKSLSNDVYYTASLKTPSRTGSDSFQCDTCGKEFLCESLFKRHLRVHTGEKQYVCKTCGKGFVKSGNLKVHCRTHTGEKPYLCKDCGKAFANSSSLIVHVRSLHTGEKPYLCKTCGKAFAESTSLVVHTRRVHTGERPYLCKTCGESFIIFADLSRHTRKVHTGERPYLCKTCGKSFINKTNLSRHIRRVHIDEKRFVCSFCGKGFFDSTHLSRHKRTHKDG